MQLLAGRSASYTLRMLRIRSFAAVLFVTAVCAAQQTPSFFPIDQWKTAVISGDLVTLKSLYSPTAQINTTAGRTDVDSAVAFWTNLKARSITVRPVEAGSPRPDVQAFTLQLKVRDANGQTTNIVEGQSWQKQGMMWRIVGEKRDLAKLEQPASVDAHLYPTGDARQQIHDTVTRASREHKNVLLVFGADWCYDCHVLDKAFHRPDIAAVLNPNFELANIDIGEGNKNLDLAAQYEVALNRGVPAVAVLDSKGALLYSQKSGEWERARALAPKDLLEFLNRWKPQSR